MLWYCLCDPKFNCFDTVPACYRRTDTMTAYTVLAQCCMVKTIEIDSGMSKSKQTKLKQFGEIY